MTAPSPIGANVTLEAGEIVIRLRIDAQPDDALLALADCGLELKAAKALVRDGKLKAVKVGRKLYVRRSSLVALVDVLPAWTAAAVDEDELAGAVAKAARRRATR